MEDKLNVNPKYTPAMLISKSRFQLGQLFSTPGALEALEFLRRHARGDWGDCCKQDWQSNDDALLHGGRLFSVYHTRERVKIWLITEADRSISTFLLPSEY